MKGYFPSAVLMICGVELAVHYEQLLNILDGVPLILAYGNPASGTATAANAPRRNIFWDHFLDGAQQPLFVTDMSCCLLYTSPSPRDA